MDEPDLKPARPETNEERPAYAPKLPWKWILALALVLVAVVAGFRYRDNSEVNQHRADLTRTYEGIGQGVTRYREFRERIESLVVAAEERGISENVADARLQLASLHKSPGLYLRIRASEATSPATIAEAAKRMGPDSIKRCLGINPISARTLYDNGAFLSAGWLEPILENTDPFRLKIHGDDLALRIERDLPTVMNTINADYFLLVLERGENRRDHPVDVFMWNLRGDEEVLAVRAQAAGMLIPARIDIPGAPRARLPTAGDSPIADDCSIAAQIKAVTGEPVQFFESEIPAQVQGEPEAEAGSESEAESEAEAEAEEETGTDTEAEAEAETETAAEGEATRASR